MNLGMPITLMKWSCSPCVPIIGEPMTTAPTTPEAPAVQALNDAEASSRTGGSVIQGISNGTVDAAPLMTVTNSILSASDSLKNVRATNSKMESHMERAANTLRGGAAEMGEIREYRQRAGE